MAATRVEYSRALILKWLIACPCCSVHSSSGENRKKHAAKVWSGRMWRIQGDMAVSLPE